MRVTCSNCGLEQKEGAFCVRCGTKLPKQTGGSPTMAFNSGGVATGRLERAAPLPVKPPPGSLLNLHIIRTGQILPVGGVGEYIVGRISTGQSILPDVDLEPFHAFKSGVSRLHARIRVESHGMWITDLGSANGTQVNNEKLTPHQDYPLGNKDVVRLGRLSIQALVGQD